MKAIDDKECKHEGVTYRGVHDAGYTVDNTQGMRKRYYFLWTCDRCLVVIKKQVQWEKG